METVVALFGVQPLRIGGVEFFTRELALALAEHGWRLVAVFGGTPTPAVAQYLSLPNLEIEVVPSLEFSTLRSLPAVGRILRRNRPRIFHYQFVDFIGPYPWFAKLHSVESVFFTAQGSNPQGFQPRPAAWWKRLLIGAINYPLRKVFCISDYVRDTFAQTNLLPPSRLRRIHNAIPVPPLSQIGSSGAAFRTRFGIPQDRKLIVQVSWMIPEKGIADVLEAAQLVLRRNPQTHFAFVGSGPPLESFRRHAAGLGIESSVTFTGLLENPMAEGVYDAADIFCLASRWQEAFGWVLAEAMSFQKAVVATRVGAIPEIVQDGVTGILVPPQNPPELAAAFLRLLNHPQRAQMGQAARRQVELRFDLRTAVRELTREYGIGLSQPTRDDTLKKERVPQ